MVRWVCLDTCLRSSVTGVTNNLTVISSCDFPGTVYIDGQERTTKLPRLHQGSTLTFDTEVLQSGKVRATIEVDDRIATFDWSVEASASATGAASLSANPMLFTAASEKKDDKKLFFALRFAGDDWKVAVE